MAQSNPTIDLHERVLADLERREAAIVEQEAEARRVLEQTLARCTAERTSIDQDRVLLVQAGKLYRRFIETNGGTGPEVNVAQPAPVPQEERSALRDLRRQLWAEHESQGGVVTQGATWTALEPVEGASNALR